MTPNLIAIVALVLGVLLGLWGGYVWFWPAGFAAGEQTGRDKQSVDDFIAQAAKERARRERNGQFRSKGGSSS